MMKYPYWALALILAAFIIIGGCGRKAIESLYTNPDAIVDLLKVDTPAREAADYDFIDTGSYYNLIAALPGDIGTIEYKLDIDSQETTYDVDVGDTVDVGSLRAKEADAYSKFAIHYSLTLKNVAGDSVVKHLTTNPASARKHLYLLQLGAFSSYLRGWVFWGTTPILNLGSNLPDVSWNSYRLGELPNSNETIMRNEYPVLAPGDRITVQYRGLSTDLVFLNINEDGTPTKIRFTRMNDVVQEADWTVSSNFGGKDYYYYAGVEVYPRETLSSSDSTKTGFSFLGLMYRIESE
jgi:hypothetical protein